MRSDSLTRTQRARRADIVAATVRVLNELGYAAASIDRIAQEAGTSKATVLYHFKTKEAIHEAVIGTLYEQGAAYMTERVMAVEGHRERLHAYLDSNLRFIAERTEELNAVHRILENAGRSFSLEDGVAPLRRLLAAGQQAGEFGEFDPQVVALVIRAVMDGASFYFSETPGLDIDHHIAEVIRMFDRTTAVNEAEPAATGRTATEQGTSTRTEAGSKGKS
jgi:AcrR family transcriptional regulator